MESNGVKNVELLNGECGGGAVRLAARVGDIDGARAAYHLARHGRVQENGPWEGQSDGEWPLGGATRVVLYQK